MKNNSFACTTLAINDKNNKLYRGRTLEFFTTGVDSQLIYYPEKFLWKFPNQSENIGLEIDVKIPYIGIGFPFDIGLEKPQNYAIEGINEKGLTYSMNMLNDSELNPHRVDVLNKTLPILAIGDWALSQFENVEEIRQNINKFNFWTPVIKNFNNIKSPFHYIFYDSNSDCIVIEITNGSLEVKNNLTNCLTNGPRLEWHLTNLNNYSHLSNVDHSSSLLGNIQVNQPDSGIATVNLPSSDTSVDRFIRAVFYTTFYKKHFNPDEQLIELSHIMNKFDRPKNITIDVNKRNEVATEYTLWTSLIDVSRGLIFIRTYDELNYKRFSFEQFKNSEKPIYIKII